MWDLIYGSLPPIETKEFLHSQEKFHFLLFLGSRSNMSFVQHFQFIVCMNEEDMFPKIIVPVCPRFLNFLIMIRYWNIKLYSWHYLPWSTFYTIMFYWISHCFSVMNTRYLKLKHACVYIFMIISDYAYVVIFRMPWFERISIYHILVILQYHLVGSNI